jgi:hypothetical protein
MQSNLRHLEAWKPILVDLETRTAGTPSRCIWTLQLFSGISVGLGLLAICMTSGSLG